MHQLLCANRLREVSGHSTINTAFPIAQKRVSRHRDNRKALSRVMRQKELGGSIAPNATTELALNASFFGPKSMHRYEFMIYCGLLWADGRAPR
jgi:hypothetical protein